ncbi:phosphoribosyltransferase [Nitrospira sp. Nam74]
MAYMFRNRREAGQVVASLLAGYRGRPDVVVLGLPRGGVPVAYELAATLHAPLDVMVVRKLGVPGHEELAMGAIASGGVQVVNEDVVRHLGLTPGILASVAAIEQQELARREHAYRGERSPVPVEGRTVILVDDGLATGSTMRAAVAALRRRDPARIVVAVPVAALETCEDLKREVDDIVCAMTPTPFYGVGEWYEEFDQTRDEEVRDLLERAAPALDRGGADNTA